MRQDASELVRRAQSGEQFTVTVAGRPAALLGPIAPRTWRTWEEIADIFANSPDPSWPQDQACIDQDIRDPWEQ